jgi:hypothetical protein
MDSNIKNLAKLYQHIKESEDISNNIASGASSRFQMDHNAKFLPIGQDMDEEENISKSKRVYDRVKTVFANMKALINACSSENISLPNLSKLIDFMDNPQVRGDLEDLKKTLQGENLENGKNTKLSSF